MMKSIADYYKDVERRVDEIRLTIHLHAHDYSLIQQFLVGLNRKDDWQGTYTQLGYESGSLQGIIVQFHLEESESFKVATPLLEYLFANGWKQAEQNENASWGYREVSFTKMHNDQPLYWPVGKEWSPKKVEDGVEPKYKFVCQEA
jgi:hypothetical protein